MFFRQKNWRKFPILKSLKAYTHIITASFYRHLELRNKAKESLDKAVRPMSLIKDEDEKAYVEGRFQLEKGLLDLLISKGNEGISSLWKSKDKFHSIENESLREFSIQLINNELAYFYLENLDKIDSSYFYFEQNLKTTEDLPLRLLAQNGIFRYHLQKNQPEKALNNISGAISDLPKIKSFRLKRDFYKTLAQIYYKENELENYTLYNQKFLKLNDSIYEIDKETRILVVQQLKRNDSEISEEKSNLILWILVILGIAIFVFGITYSYHLKVKKEYARFLEIMHELEENEKAEALSKENDLAGSFAMSEKTEQIILDKLKKFENSEKYLNPKMSLQLLAKLLETNTKYLSEIVNKNKGQNFNHYINELRINYILRKIKAESKYRNYKVSSLAEECGFGSRNTFTTAFKHFTGMSPATFVGFMKKENYHNKL